MGLSQPYTPRVFAAFLICGVFCSVLYDVFRIIRFMVGAACYTEIGRKRFGCRLENTVFSIIFILLGDLIFGVLSGVFFSIWLYVFANGIFRWFFLAAFGIGLFFYRIFLGKIFMVFFESLAFWTVCVVKYCMCIFVVPIRIGIRFTRNVLRWLYRKWLQRVSFRIRMRMCRRYTMKMQSLLSEIIRFTE